MNKFVFALTFLMTAVGVAKEPALVSARYDDKVITMVLSEAWDPSTLIRACYHPPVNSTHLPKPSGDFLLVEATPMAKHERFVSVRVSRLPGYVSVGERIYRLDSTATRKVEAGSPNLSVTPVSNP